MNPSLAFAGRYVGVTLRGFFWLHPEWWGVVLSCGAWAVMLLHGRQNAGHSVHHRITFVQEIAFWMLMVTAMMLPLVTDAVRFTASASFWARRHRAIVGFLLGYFAPWLGLAIVAATLRHQSLTHTYAAPAL